MADPKLAASAQSMANARALDQMYVQWKQANPTLKWAMDMLPVTGQVNSLMDANADYKAGKYGAAALDMMGLVPGSRLIRGMGMVKSAKQFAGPLWDAARWYDRGADTAEYLQMQNQNNTTRR